MQKLMGLVRRCVEDYHMKRMIIMSLPIFVELFLQLLVGNVDQISAYRQQQQEKGM